MYESIGLTTGDGDSTTIYGANQTAEAFTLTEGHSVVLVNLMLKRVGAAPGNVTVEITEASGNVSNGAFVASATLDGDLLSTSYTKIPVTFTETILENGQQYAIVVSAVSGDSSNYILWQKHTAGTAHLSSNSTNGGASWTTSASDMLFEVWGNPSLKIVSANVFSGYPLARVAQHGTKQEQTIVKRKVHKKWPSIDISKG